MFLKFSMPPNEATILPVFESQLVFVILGLTILVFFILRINKFLSKMSFNKAANKAG